MFPELRNSLKKGLFLGKKYAGRLPGQIIYVAEIADSGIMVMTPLIHAEIFPSEPHGYLYVFFIRKLALIRLPYDLNLACRGLIDFYLGSYGNLFNNAVLKMDLGADLRRLCISPAKNCSKKIVKKTVIIFDLFIVILWYLAVFF